MILFLLFIVGLYIGNRSPFWLGNFISNFQRRQWIKEVAPIAVDEFRLCYGRHEWIDIKTFNEEGQEGSINVCDKCGFMPTKNMMMPRSGLMRLKETQQAMEYELNLEKTFLSMEETDIKTHFSEEIQGGLEFKKLVQLYNAGQSSKQRYILYKIAKNEELKAKSDA